MKSNTVTELDDETAMLDVVTSALADLEAVSVRALSAHQDIVSAITKMGIKSKLGNVNTRVTWAK